MKKVLIAKSDLPLSMSEVSAPQAPFPSPCPPSQYAPAPVIQNELLDVLFNNHEITVLKSVLSGDVYTIDNYHGITMNEPTERELVIFHYLGELGLGTDLKIHHYVTIECLFDNGTLSIPESSESQYAYRCTFSSITLYPHEVINLKDDSVYSKHFSEAEAKQKCADLNAKDKG